MGGENNLSYWTSFRSRLNNLSVSDVKTLTLTLTLALSPSLTLTPCHRHLRTVGGPRR